jgi:O-methyltransferase
VAPPHYPDIDPDFVPLFNACRHATMTSVERLYALYKAVEYVVRHEIGGDFVECGVWRGGSVMMAVLALKQFGGVGRTIHCFDTFEGMPEPGALDIHNASGVPAARILAAQEPREDNVYWAIAPLETVRANMVATGYPLDLVHYHQGKVEDTLPACAPHEIALLRLDTDWYQSTRHELECLYPRLNAGGVLIIDDYGFWRGARHATDEYFSRSRSRILLNRIDGTGRIGVKLS